LLGPIFAIKGLDESIGGIIYGGHPEAFRVSLQFERKTQIKKFTTVF